jgi:RNA polymerase sigma-70 factor (ECF subfamily)
MEQPGMNEEIIQNFRRGDQQAFAVIFRLHYRPLCYFAAQLVKELSEAEDIVKDSFVKLWGKYADFDNAQTIKSFLYITTRNACLNSLRHEQVKNTVHKELAYLENDRGHELMLNQLIRLELMQEIYNEIEKMPEKRREVFKLSFIEGMKNAEIAQHLNLSIFTVKEHKAKALAYLRLRFSDKYIMLLLLLFAKANS